MSDTQSNDEPAANGQGVVNKTVRLPSKDTPPPAKEPDTITSLQPEPLISQYSILEKIADGGMGVVYLGKDRNLGRYVAIKRIRPSLLANHSMRQRFFREAKAIAALRHIHIAHVYYLGQDSEGPYIVMEYVSGPLEIAPHKMPAPPFSLADLVHRDGTLPLQEALEVIIKVCRGIEYAHSCGVIHRDLKPSNILLDESYEPKIVDFGLARKHGQDDYPITARGDRMFSLGYGAPEQEVDASETDERTDVYGLGALFYFSITGQNPRFFRESDVPEALRMPILKAIETDREKRWSSVREFISALMLARSPSSSSVPTAKSTWRCKWCDTINPVAIRFCGRCGWDGGEFCAECGSETRIGIQFCGACGADARQYEMVMLTRAKLARLRDQKAFETIVQQEGPITGFQPVGASGRTLLREIQGFYEDAKKAIARRQELTQLIDREVSNENFERAREYIEEYNTLATDNAFEAKARDLQDLSLQRDLRLAHRAMAQREWDYAERMCEALSGSADPANRDVRTLARAIRRHRLRVRVRNAAVAATVLFFLYAFSAAPVYRFTGRTRTDIYNSFFSLATYMHDVTVLRFPMEQYARLWGVADLYEPQR